MTGDGRPRCGGPKGKAIYLTREEARAAVRVLRVRYGRAKAKRCTWGEHYHVTKGLLGRKGRGSR